MANNQDFIEFCLENLSFVQDLRARKMFGEYGIFSGKYMFAIIADNILFLKIFPETIGYFSDTTTKAYPGSKNTAPVNPEWLEENSEELEKIVMITIELVEKSKK